MQALACVMLMEVKHQLLGTKYVHIFWFDCNLCKIYYSQCLLVENVMLQCAVISHCTICFICEMCFFPSCLLLFECKYHEKTANTGILLPTAWLGSRCVRILVLCFIIFNWAVPFLCDVLISVNQSAFCCVFTSLV